MADNLWKKFEKSDFIQAAKLKLRQSYGREPKFLIDKKYAITVFGDWGIPLGQIKTDDIMYSFGVCDDIDFELALIHLKAIEIFAFDPTPFSIDWIAKQSKPTNLHFYPYAASAEDGEFYLYPLVSKKGQKSSTMYSFSSHQESRDEGVLVKALALKSAMDMNGHTKVDVLKMDIEGAEYEFIASIMADDIKPRIILVEFHHRFHAYEKQDTIRTVGSLCEAGYSIVYISPAGREMCFLLDNSSHAK